MAIHALIPNMEFAKLRPGRLFGVMFLMMTLLTALRASAQTVPTTAIAPNYSGMYTFLRDGEFVQLSIENDGSVTGFVSRYGDSESDKGEFLDQFFKIAKLEGNELTFTTKAVHDVWYAFQGTVSRGEGKTLADEGYYAMKGKLTEYRGPQGKQPEEKLRDVVLKSFPRDAAPN